MLLKFMQLLPRKLRSLFAFDTLIARRRTAYGVYLFASTL